jgi:hypothetical protein
VVLLYGVWTRTLANRLSVGLEPAPLPWSCDARRTTPRDRVGTAQRTPARCLSLRRDTTDVWPPSSGPKGEAEARLGGVLSRCKRMEPCVVRPAPRSGRAELRQENAFTQRAVFLASLEDCQGCCLREQCLRPGAKGNRARRKSAVRRLLPVPATLLPQTGVLQATRWRDVAGRALRRTWTAHWRKQFVEVLPLAENPHRASPPPRSPRAIRSHQRWSWQDRLARHGWWGPPSFRVTIAGVPSSLAVS